MLQPSHGFVNNLYRINGWIAQNHMTTVKKTSAFVTLANATETGLKTVPIVTNQHITKFWLMQQSSWNSKVVTEGAALLYVHTCWAYFSESTENSDDIVFRLSLIWGQTSFWPMAHDETGWVSLPKAFSSLANDNMSLAVAAKEIKPWHYHLPGNWRHWVQQGFTVYSLWPYSISPKQVKFQHIKYFLWKFNQQKVLIPM